ncbi:MAG: glycosyltransferase family 87 protein [Candidatus Korobacteraceae bacterium]
MALACYTLNYLYLRPVVLRTNPTVDFSCYYRSGKMVVSGAAAKIYDVSAQRQYDRELQKEIAPGKWLEYRPFNYPPFVLLVFAPLSLLPYHQAELAWYSLNAAMLLSLPFTMLGILGRGKLLAYAVVAPALFLPTEFALIQGQSSIMVLLALGLVIAKLVEGNEGSAGCALAIAMWKPQLALPMLVALVFAARWRAVAGFLGASVALFLASASMLGVRTTLGFPEAVLQFRRLPQGSGGDYPLAMPNIRGISYLLLRTRFPDGILQPLILVFSLALIILAAIAFKTQASRNLGLACALVVTVTVMTSYHCYLHDLSLLILPFLLVAADVRWRGISAWPMVALLAISAVFIVPFVSGAYQRSLLTFFAATVVLGTSLVMTMRGVPCHRPRGKIRGLTESPSLG